MASYMKTSSGADIHIHCQLHSSNNYLLNTYYVPGAVIGNEDAMMSKRDLVPALWHLQSSGGDTHTQIVTCKKATLC